MDNTLTMDKTLDVKLDGKTLLLIAVIAFGALVTALSTVSVWYLNTKFEGVYTHLDDRFEGMDRYLEARFDRVDEKFDSVNARIDSMNARIDRHEIILNNIRDRVASIEGRMESNSPETQASVAHSPVTGSTL